MPIHLETGGRRSAGWMLGFTVFVMLVLGLGIRRTAWDWTSSIRFESDIRHAFEWGQVSKQVGLFHVYDEYAAGKIRGTNELDYTPFRLLAATAWAYWAQNRFPGVTRWSNDYELTKFMLYLNTIAELASSVLVFLIIRHWVRRRDHSPPGIRPSSSWLIPGSIGGLLFWFNPAVIWDGHAWPQWDSWNMPFFLGAVLLASMDWWIAAGCSIVIGAFFKGQILLVAPIFILWPMIGLQYGAALRFVSGFAVVGALLALPWMHPTWGPLPWLALVGLVGALLGPVVARWNLRRRWRIGLVVAAAVVLLIPCFGASWTWYTLGFEFGTYKNMHMGRPGTNSLPTVLESSFKWTDGPNAELTVPLLERSMSLRSFMITIYAACLVICGIGAAIQSRRNDPRFLVAMVAPWLCWFVLLPQMNNRYLVWAAAFSALLPAVSLGMSLLGVIVSTIAWIGIARTMCESGGEPTLSHLLVPLTPHLAWVILLLAAIYLYVAITPSRSSTDP